MDSHINPTHPLEPTTTSETTASQTQTTTTTTTTTNTNKTTTMRIDEEDSLPNKFTPLSIDINETNHRWKIKTFNSIDCKYIAHEQCRQRSPPMCRVPFNHKSPSTSPVPSSSSGTKAEEDDTQFIHNHHWVEGNLKSVKSCIVCTHKIETSFSLANYRCTWCSECIHSQCFDKRPLKCTMGELHEMIIPPSSIQMIDGDGISLLDSPILSPNPIGASEDKKKNSTLQWKLVSPIPTKTLFIFINSKSGGQMGETFIRKFSAIVNPFQIFDLIRDGPDQAITIIRDYLLEHPQDQNRIRLLVCGGDGTVGWVLQVLKKYNLPPLPISIIPLGTGNDMARSLGWGPGYDNEKLTGILKDISDAHLTNLDTWEINIKHDLERDQEQDKMIVMNNYFSIGLDAHIALGFHEARNANPKLFIGRTINKMWYGKIGLGEFVSKSFVRLHDVLELVVDERVIDIDPAIEGIMIINVNNYAGGADLWKGKRPNHLQPLEIDDGKIELVGVTGVAHMGTVISGMASPIKIAQGHSISIRYKAPANPKKIKHTRIAVQVDGEPFKVHDCSISITFQRKVSMLVKKGFHTKSHHDNENVDNNLYYGESINNQQSFVIATSPSNNGQQFSPLPMNERPPRPNTHNGHGDLVELDLMIPSKQQLQNNNETLD
ncbi:diacylglycerol kinase [Cavenderia fasciculata]|uniref:Diacylglycerol kinase n=1 Tax=Cavenderia fasciculata TaxID=261658 RepID=F4Q0G2_CACFS|nr:diacylglycerol kinase [Cavenderia fasciculata]EGG18313.1 diacylglycerol kinase [Cavenderia fasciculata]|eukprot:XP_004357136.1 diacylglycerol kinase [Cavenderia fasciculata]